MLPAINKCPPPWYHPPQYPIPSHVKEAEWVPRQKKNRRYGVSEDRMTYLPQLEQEQSLPQLPLNPLALVLEEALMSKFEAIEGQG